MRILTRYVLVELAKVFLVSLIGLTLLFLVLVVVKEATDRSLPLVHVLRLVPYALPMSLSITIPVTLLLACTTVYSRMSGANEVVAAKALGISPMALLTPAFFLALLLSLATVWIDDLAASWGRNGIERVAIDAAVNTIYSLLRAHHSYSCSIFSINVRGIQGQTLLQPKVVIQGRGAASTMTIEAEEAVLESSKAEGVLKIFLRRGTIAGGKMKMQFPDLLQPPPELPLRETSTAGGGESGKPSWLPLWVIQGEIVKQEARIEQYERKMAADAAYQNALRRLCLARRAGVEFDLRRPRNRTDPAESFVDGATPSLGRRIQLPLLCTGRRPDRRPASQPRFPHQFLPLFCPHPDRLLSLADVRAARDEGRNNAPMLGMGRQCLIGDLGHLGAEEGCAILSKEG